MPGLDVRQGVISHQVGVVLGLNDLTNLVGQIARLPAVGSNCMCNGCNMAFTPRPQVLGLIA